MKNFTRLVSLVLMGFVGLTATAQYDLEATELRTMSTTSNEVPPNIPLILTLVFENTGTADIDPAAHPKAKDPKANGDIADSLRQLKALHDEGILTDDEYETKRKSLAEQL